jgi:hypothetical protein
VIAAAVFAVLMRTVNPAVIVLGAAVAGMLALLGG